jgi:hypothetical protein
VCNLRASPSVCGFCAYAIPALNLPAARRRSTSLRLAPFTLCAGLSLWSGLVLGDAPEVTPYRPTVSNPAALSAPGLLEFEGGVERIRDGTGITLFSTPYLFKYAFSDNVGVLLGGDAYVRREDADGGHLTGLGDTVAEIKLRHALSETMALGLETGMRLPTAKTGLGSGKSDYIANGIFSADLGALDFDFNLAYTRLGAVDDGEGRGEIDWAAALSGKFGGPWGWAAEVSGTARHGTRGGSQALAALTWQPLRTLAFDIGLAHDLNRQTDLATLFAGFVVLFDRH